LDQATQHIVRKNKFKWIAVIFVELLLIVFAVGLLAHLILFKWGITISLPILFLVCVVMAIVIGFIFYNKNVNDRNVLRLISRQYAEVEESTHLLLQPESELNLIGKLQRAKIQKVLSNLQVKLSHKHRIFSYFLIFLSSLVLNLAFYYFPIDEAINNSNNIELNIHRADSTQEINSKFEPITIKKVELEIKPPYYTNQRKLKQENWNIKAIEGSLIKWDIVFSGEVENVQIKFSSEKHVKLKRSNDSFQTIVKIFQQGFYELSFTDTLGNRYSSEFYKVEVAKDNVPEIKIEGIPQYSEFEFNEVKKVDFTTLINDDFGLTDASITATITKGSGESVKFREEKLSFDNQLNKNVKEDKLIKSIDFNEMGMEPGDELYFYVEAIDNKQPKNNISRSETYFLVLIDTANYEFSLEGNLGVDLMPDYFRSQRQIIIDTEKLLANKTKLSDHEFNSRSNELGFDQKTLRLKYGQFMGEEDDSGIAIQDDVEVVEEENSEGENEEIDPLTGFKHDHDNENEHNLVDDHEQELNEEGEVEEDPLEDYEHSHDSEEVATFLTNTIKGKLRAAMNLMWDAELYLRLYQPQNSLPYQYKALKLIKEIKNHARIYVHRIGFDPPPIKEESRLSGDLDEIFSQHQKTITHNEDFFIHTKQVLRLLNKEVLRFDDSQNFIFEECGREISRYAIQNPGRYLPTLQWLKQLSEGKVLMISELVHLQKDLFSIIPEESQLPVKQQKVTTELKELFYEKLSEGRDDR